MKTSNQCQLLRKAIVLIVLQAPFALFFSASPWEVTRCIWASASEPASSTGTHRLKSTQNTVRRTNRHVVPCSHVFFLLIVYCLTQLGVGFVARCGDKISNPPRAAGVKAIRSQRWKWQWMFCLHWTEGRVGKLDGQRVRKGLMAR